MIPKDAPDVRVYAEAIARFSDLLALAAWVPVLIECRFGSLSSRTKLWDEPAPPQQKKESAEQQEQSQEQKKEEEAEGKAPQSQNASTERKWPVVPIGLPSAFLFIASEALACQSIFVAVSKAGAKGKSKSTPKGGLGVLLEGIAKAQKALKGTSKTKAPDQSIAPNLDRIFSVLVLALEKPEAFDTVQSIATIVGLTALVISIIGRTAWPAAKLFGQQGAGILLRVASIAVPIAIFGVLRWDMLYKAWRAFQVEHMLSTLQLPLRVAALIAAARPLSEAGSTPAAFATLQAGSLAASLSAEIANGGLAKAIAPFTSYPLVTAIFDSQALTYLVPTTVALMWVSTVHLQRKPGQLMMTALLSIMSTPISVALGWAKVAPALGMDNTKPQESLLQVLTLLWAFTAISVFFAGGTVSLLASVLFSQVMLRIHGAEPFGALVQ